MRRELNVGEEKYKEKACFMNLCMIQDEQGNVLALDKMNDSYTGTTFPGGHVEPGEPFREAVIRGSPGGNRPCDPKSRALRHLSLE